MLKSSLISIPILVFVAAVAPATVALGSVGKKDAKGIYLLLRTPTSLSVQSAEAASTLADIGVVPPPFGRLVQIAPEAHDVLIQSGFWLLPAKAFASICGASARNSDYESKDI